MSGIREGRANLDNLSRILAWHPTVDAKTPA